MFSSVRYKKSTNLSILVHSIGIYLLYSLSGIYNEKISTHKYGNSNYKSTLFPMVLQCLGGVFVSKFLSRLKGESLLIKDFKIIFYYVLLSFLALTSTFLWRYSLNFLSYPTVIISKCCKLLSIAIMNFLILKKKFDNRKYFSILLTTVSVLCFSMSGKSNNFTFKGIFFLILNLSLDGLLNVTQDNVFKKFNVSSGNVMFYNNLIRLIMSLILMILTKDINYSYEFIRLNPEILKDLIFSSLLNVLGQLVIYSMLEKHGSLVLTTVNISRNMLSIILSLVLFGHGIGITQCICILGVIISISLDLLHDKKKKDKLI
ncbi:UDP-galactose transporter [Nosema bombycis CQ1]|uniref:UDP-galactose transporter n=1 Tax=Nosema bombycis (strain CQ1 / CVCC 102059) TaxID=578461 RepID=R0MLG5_NOSB1|nr:UDP-galactose transporter [Nosema bombycis CQ1]|eukprot:EOB13673.1 UDP-galactose transporter [Nosema bombycis CQ1]